MKVAIMQPYIFPYLGYYQLINAVDTFVIYDDVNFIKKGWINRNKILLNGNDFMFNIILKGASQNKKINEIEVEGNNYKLISSIEYAYHKAPYFTKIYPLLTNIVLYKEINLAKYLTNSLLTIIGYLNIKTSILISSEIEKNKLLKGENRIINICNQLKATNYINLLGGQELYSKEKFAENNLILNFIKSNPIVYQHFRGQFTPILSIIDVLMFNASAEISTMLDNYILI